MNYVFKMISSPVGELRLIASENGLAGVLWQNENPKRFRSQVMQQVREHPLLCETERQLNEYFVRQRRAFTLPLDFAGTVFQQKVWQALLDIPWGETRSYADIALQIGHPTAVRAVGAANGQNPISIIAPCHRVIGSNGKLTGFAGGLDVKAILLNIETVVPPAEAFCLE